LPIGTPVRTSLRGSSRDSSRAGPIETHLRLLERSDEIVIAVDEQIGAVVGFITAITDRVLSAYIPFLEVLPEYRGRGIGSELVRRMLERLAGLYMVDVLCDEEVLPFYQKLGMRRAKGAMLRNREYQSGTGR
jgi:ribosomal protein S18 acetylase RimI-like enzyme